VTPTIEDSGWTEHRGSAYRFRVVLSPDPDGGYTATVPRLPGAVSEGDTEAAAIDNIKEAITGLLAAYRDRGEPIPWRQDEPTPPPDGLVRTVFVNV